MIGGYNLNYLSQHGLEKVKSILSKSVDKTVPNLRIDVNGESFFLSNDVHKELELIALDCGFNCVFTFSLHQNEIVIPIVLNPLEDFTTYFLQLVHSKLALNFCSVKIDEKNSLSFNHFSELVENLTRKKFSFVHHLNHAVSISDNPLL